MHLNLYLVLIFKSNLYFLVLFGYLTVIINQILGTIVSQYQHYVIQFSYRGTLIKL